MATACSRMRGGSPSQMTRPHGSSCGGAGRRCAREGARVGGGRTGGQPPVALWPLVVARINANHVPLPTAQGPRQLLDLHNGVGGGEQRREPKQQRIKIGRHDTHDTTLRAGAVGQLVVLPAVVGGRQGPHHQPVLRQNAGEFACADVLEPCHHRRLGRGKIAMLRRQGSWDRRQPLRPFGRCRRGGTVTADRCSKMIADSRHSWCSAGNRCRHRSPKGIGSGHCCCCRDGSASAAKWIGDGRSDRVDSAHRDHSARAL